VCCRSDVNVSHLHKHQHPASALCVSIAPLRAEMRGRIIDYLKKDGLAGDPPSRFAAADRGSEEAIRQPFGYCALHSLKTQ
jgi:hypothetical protein